MIAVKVTHTLTHVRWRNATHHYCSRCTTVVRLTKDGRIRLEEPE